MFVKICGLSTIQDVEAAARAGADAVGFVLTASPRQVTPAQARRLVEAVPAGVLSVAVFSGEPLDQVRRDALEAGVGAVQLHGDHPASAFAELRDLGLELVRATTASAAAGADCGDFGEDLLILDSPLPGSGESWDWSELGAAPPGGRWMLAGGLAPHNVAEAIAAARPWGVDVSSGVEVRRGVKSPELIEEFVRLAKAAPAAAAAVPAAPAAAATEVAPDLAALRLRIDTLDGQLVALLAERLAVVHEVARHKTDEAAVRAPDRVQQVIDRVRAHADRHDIPADLVERLYHLLIEELTTLELDRTNALRQNPATQA